MMDNPPDRFDADALAHAIDHMSQEELTRLNHMIVDRLKLIQQAHATAAMARLHAGGRVSFTDSAGQQRTGAIIRLNKKTASVLTDDQQRWNVSPHLLQPIKPV